MKLFISIILTILFSLFFFKVEAQQKIINCNSAQEVLNKKAIVIDEMGQGGLENENMADYFCFLGGETPLNEENTYWLSWVCTKNGTFNFSIRPEKEGDDIDFAVFLTDSTSNNFCKDKKIVRCMAAGEQTYPSICLGATGLKSVDRDLVEFPGCYDGQNSFLKELNMLKGERYFLFIKNQTSKHGFTIKFGGKGLIGSEDSK